MQDKKIDLENSISFSGNSLNDKREGNKFYFGKYILITLITSFVVILFSYIITNARQERFRMLETKKILEKQVVQLRLENDRLENEHSSLQEDPGRIEKEAREQLGYLAPGEVSYDKYNFNIKSITRKKPDTMPAPNRWKSFLFDGPFPWQFPTLIILITAAYYLITYHYEYRRLYKSER
ncbi:MAG: septum formation initiator family protein [Candidatus Kuenenia sp.]|nr:septum formation initiator family protein [Candidatus Kuenenia hertensis]